MRKSLALCATLAITMGCIAMQQDSAADEDTKKARVTGIGGVFFLSTGNGKDLSAWYAEHLGIVIADFGGGVIEWKDDTASDGGLTVWATANKDSTWFSPSKSSFMINYRVDDLEKLIEQLQAADIEIIGGPEYHENGAFAWIMDPEGNKVELWEPKLWDDKNKK